MPLLIQLPSHTASFHCMCCGQVKLPPNLFLKDHSPSSYSNGIKGGIPSASPVQLTKTTKEDLVYDPCQTYILASQCIWWMHFHLQIYNIIIPPTKLICLLRQIRLTAISLIIAVPLNKIFPGLLITCSCHSLPLKYHFTAS